MTVPPTPPTPVPAPGPRLQRWARWALLAVGAVLVLECVSRVEERIGNGIPLLSRIRAAGDLVWFDSAGARGRPNARYRRWHLNALGTRGPEVEATKPPNLYRIVVTGSSETFGLYESNGREYPRLLEDSLRARAAAACPTDNAKEIEVLNAALPGMAIPSMAQHLQSLVKSLSPDLVVIYPSPGFYLGVQAPRASSRTSTDSGLPLANALELRAIARITDQIKAIMPDAVMTAVRGRLLARRLERFPEGTRFTSVPEQRLTQWEADLRALIGASRIVAPEVVLMGHANATMEPGFSDEGLLTAWEYQFPRATGPVIAAFHGDAVEREARVARDSSVTYVDLPAAFAGHWQESFADFVHFTDAGSARVASLLADAVVVADGPLCSGAGSR